MIDRTVTLELRSAFRVSGADADTWMRNPCTAANTEAPPEVFSLAYCVVYGR
jgi:hypothetical protein